jgi:hypothetical protein
VWHGRQGGEVRGKVVSISFSVLPLYSPSHPKATPGGRPATSGRGAAGPCCRHGSLSFPPYLPPPLPPPLAPKIDGRSKGRREGSGGKWQ